MAVNIIQKTQSLIIYGFALILLIICGCMYYKSLNRTTIYLNEENQCIIAHNGDRYIACDKLKSTNLEYALNHYRVVRFTKDIDNELSAK